RIPGDREQRLELIAHRRIGVDDVVVAGVRLVVARELEQQVRLQQLGLGGKRGFGSGDQEQLGRVVRLGVGLLLHEGPGDLVERVRVVRALAADLVVAVDGLDRKSTRLNSSHVKISYAVFCLKKKKRI